METPSTESWRGKDESVDARGMQQREIDRDARPARQSDQRCAFNVQRVEECFEVVMGRIRNVRRRRSSKAARVIAHYPVTLGQRQEVLTNRRHRQCAFVCLAPPFVLVIAPCWPACAGRIGGRRGPSRHRFGLE